MMELCNHLGKRRNSDNNIIIKTTLTLHASERYRGTVASTVGGSDSDGVVSGVVQ